MIFYYLRPTVGGGDMIGRVGQPVFFVVGWMFVI